MIRTILAAALAAVISVPAMAEGEYAEGSQAKGWKNLQGREAAVFEAKVVDILCELTGDCAENCGGGKRQMGLMRVDDGKLILAGKNSQTSFNGATVDLAPYCNQTVTVDGLLVGSPEVTPAKFYLLQLVQREGSDKWAKAARFTRMWKRDYKEHAKKKGPWFRHDPRIAAEIEANGYLGLGAEADAKFIEENY
ncbi:MAG: hypothetical protein AAF439_04810 [Pseudomonadota bacterium]